MRRRRRVSPRLSSLNHLRVHTVRSSSTKQELAIVPLRADSHILASRNEDRIARDELDLLAVKANGDLTAHAVQELVVGRSPGRGAVALALAEGDVRDGEVAVGLDRGGERRDDGAGGFVPEMRTRAVGEEVRSLRVVGERHIARVPSMLAGHGLAPVRGDLVDVVCLDSSLEFLAREGDSLVRREWDVVFGSPGAADVGEEVVEACGLDEAEELGLLSDELVGVVVVGWDHGEVALAEIFGYAVGPDGH